MISLWRYGNNPSEDVVTEYIGRKQSVLRGDMTSIIEAILNCKTTLAYVYHKLYFDKMEGFTIPRRIG